MNNIISVIIPCWNEERHISDMLDCLLKQKFQDWCAYCVDDQSTDGMAEVIKAYQAKDERIRYVCRDREPKGGQTCRNIGMKLARDAKYVTFFDADDLIAPYCLEQRVAFMEQHPELGCGVFPIIGYFNDLQEEQSPVFGFKTFEDDLMAMLNLSIPMAVSTNVYRVEALHENNISWDENVRSMQDSDFSFQVILSGMPYDYARDAKADYFYRMHDNGVAGQIYKPAHIESHVYLIKKVIKAITKKYGNSYDSYIGVYIARMLLKMRKYVDYKTLKTIPWVNQHSSYKLRILIYTLCGQRLWRLFFRKYRTLSMQMNNKWQSQTIDVRAKLLERGATLPQ